jgi:hypothetical protein
VGREALPSRVFGKVEDAVKLVSAEEIAVEPDDGIDGEQVEIVVSSEKDAGVLLGPVEEEAISDPARGLGLHLDVDAGLVDEGEAYIESNALVGREVFRNFRVEDDEVLNGRREVDDGLDHGPQETQVALQEGLEDEVGRWVQQNHWDKGSTGGGRVT